MEYKEISQTDVTVSELPRWVKILFRLYAALFLLGTIVAAIQLIHLVLTRGKELFAAVTDSSVSTSGTVAIIIIAISAAILLLYTIYGIGVYRFRRWTLPLVLTFSFSALLFGFFSLYNTTFSGAIELVGLLAGMMFVSVVGYAAIVYWSFFSGSARKLRMQIPLLLVLAPFMLFVILSQIFPDDRQINDSDMLLQPIAMVPQADNAHYALPEIDALSALEKQEYTAALEYARESEDDSLNTPEALAIVSQTKYLTDAVIAASSRDSYQCPTSVNQYGFTGELCSLGDIRDLALLTVFRANAEADSGDMDQAIITAGAVVKLGGLVGSTEHPLLIEHLVGVAVADLGLQSLERTLRNSSTVSDQAIRSVIADLEESKISQKSFADSLRREYMSTKVTSESFAQHSNYFYQHNKTVNQRAEVFRRGVAIVSQGCNADTAIEQQKADRLVKEITKAPFKWPLISPNYFGKTLNSVVVASFSSAGERGCEVNDLNESVQAQLRDQMGVEAPMDDASL